MWVVWIYYYINLITKITKQIHTLCFSYRRTHADMADKPIAPTWEYYYTWVPGELGYLVKCVLQLGITDFDRYFKTVYTFRIWLKLENKQKYNFVYLFLPILPDYFLNRAFIPDRFPFLFYNVDVRVRSKSRFSWTICDSIKHHFTYDDYLHTIHGEWR